MLMAGDKILPRKYSCCSVLVLVRLPTGIWNDCAKGTKYVHTNKYAIVLLVGRDSGKARNTRELSIDNNAFSTVRPLPFLFWKMRLTWYKGAA